MKAKPETVQELRTLILLSEGKSIEDSCWNDRNSDITGERVLRALNQKSPKYALYPSLIWNSEVEQSEPVDGYVEFYVWDSMDSVYLPSIAENWKLCQPAHEQEEKTLRAIIELLKCNKL